MEKGLSFKTIEGEIVTLRLALIFSKTELDHAIEILDEAIGEVEARKLY